MGQAFHSPWERPYNPAELDGFEFVEFSAPEDGQLASLFEQLGFNVFARHQSKPLTWYKQGNIHFLVNGEDHGFAADFAKQHGPCACAMGFSSKDAFKAYSHALSQKAKPCKHKMLEFQLPALYGVGNSILYLVDEIGRSKLYEDYFEVVKLEDEANNAGLTYIDHLTHNVHRGHMDQWAEFYERVFNFREIRHFNIKGQLTGLVSRAMTSPCGKLRIPINEGTDDQSQIEEFLNEYHGEGIQHIALGTDNIYHTVAALKDKGVHFMDVPDTYYEMIDQRLPGHHEALRELRENRILIDGHVNEDGRLVLLLQIFTEPLIGPIFFEIIQRKGDDGFGEGNFQALFESIERDQIERGVLKQRS